MNRKWWGGTYGGGEPEHDANETSGEEGGGIAVEAEVGEDAGGVVKDRVNTGLYNCISLTFWSLLDERHTHWLNTMKVQQIQSRLNRPR